MKKIFTIFTIFYICLFYCQDSEFYEIMGAKKVIINKKFISYVLVANKIENNKEINEQTFGPDLQNPHTIYISSDGENSTIRINTKNIIEETTINFGRIYKVNGSGEFEIYEFVPKNNCSATLMRPKGRVRGDGDQGITITCVDSKKNGNKLDFSIYKEL